jgi:serine/threonine protein kinase
MRCDHRDGLTERQQRRLVQIVEPFEDHWKATPRPQLEATLGRYGASLPPAEPLRSAILIDLVRFDLALRLREGLPVDIPADYLGPFPELAHCRTCLADLFEMGYRSWRRTRNGARPALEVYLEQVPPGCLDEVRLRLSPIAGYELLEDLGRGGMGVVYKARQLRPDRLVALKMLQSGALADAEDLERFRLDSETIARLEHPNIVKVFDVGLQRDGLPYFTMEYIEGGSLRRRLGGTALSGREAAQLVAALADAAHFAHGRGIVHRDLKPDNILVPGPADLPAGKWVPRLTDFGLAKRLGEEGQTKTGQIMGTPSYLSPEQARGGSVDARSDIYSLGAILYELLTGRPPFRAATLAEALAFVEAEPLRPSRLQPQLDRDVETICLKCLEKDPARRYPDAAELAADLHRYLSHEPIRARPASPWRRGWKWSRRHPTTAASAILIALAALTLGLMAYRHDRNLREVNDQLSRQRDRAGERFGFACKAMETMIDDLNAQALEPAPVPLSRTTCKLLDNALEFYDRFLRDDGDPPNSFEVARTYARMAEIHCLLQDSQHPRDHRQQAEDLYKEAQRRLETRGVSPAGEAERLRELARTLNGLSLLYHKSGRQKPAVETIQQAIDICRKLFEESGNSPDARKWARRLDTLGYILETAREPEQAERRLKQAQEVYREEVALLRQLCDPARAGAADIETEDRMELAGRLFRLGQIARQLGDHQQAVIDLEGCSEVLRAILKEEPRAVDVLEELVRVQTDLGRILQSTDPPELEQAERAYREAHKEAQGLIADHPDEESYEEKRSVSRKQLLEVAELYRERARKRRDVDPEQADQDFQRARRLDEEFSAPASHRHKPRVARRPD